MCRFNTVANFRVVPTCPHHVVEQMRIRVNDDQGFQTFCVSCHELVSWSTRQPYPEKIEGKVSELTEEDRKKLA